MAKLKYTTTEDEITFNLLDVYTVDRLTHNGDVKLPKKKIDIPKDEQWNTKQLSSRLLQGILNGDSIPHIANRLMDIVGNNAASAIRNARTMVTGAENSGRLDSYKDLAEKGVVQRKIWIATLDDRTRESHAEIDGEETEIDQAFSNGLMYPGDPDGDPSEVWNCRCSMKDHIVGFRRADGSISYVAGEEPKDQEKQVQRNDQTNAEENQHYAMSAEQFNDEAEKQGLDLTADDIEDYVESSYGAYRLGDKISEFIDNAPDEMKVENEVIYRGFHFEDKTQFDNFIRLHGEGDILKSRRDGLSWTTDRNIADVFGKESGEYYVILVNEDEIHNAISIKNIADTLESSSEVLYSSSTDFEIVEVEMQDNHAVLYVTASPMSEKKYK